MNIKSLLLGSAAALAVVSGAQAADAIVAAEPEPMEYVRVCDAFGTGFFYIPGTETCLKISGEVRATVNFQDTDTGSYFTGADDDAWDSGIRARVNFEAKNDSEIGTIGSFIRFEGTEAANDIDLNQAFITVGGFKVGLAATFWDDVGIAGENDSFAGDTVYKTISYTYASDAFSVGVGIDDLSGVTDEVGAQGFASATLGAATVALYGVYDFSLEEGAVVLQGSADIGPGKLSAYAGYASGFSAYVTSADVTAEWTVGAAYGFKATDKLTITPSANYWSDVDFVDNQDGWAVGVLAEYALAEGLTASATVDYFDIDNHDNDWKGFVRLTRSF